MTINTDLLVSAAMLQDYLVDKDTGMPLVNGIISLYKDTSRTLYKNWYYQTGTPGAYTWIALDNPLRLSSVGTIQDPYGNDVIPFYYPFEENNENVAEPYYITVYSADENGDPDVLQFTRENFPHMPSNVSPDAQNPTFRNYIINNVYWRNLGTLDAMSVTDQVIAPSQHDGFTNGDIRFLKNVTGANDDLAFLPMTETLDNDITPETYIHFQCSGIQAGETVKCIQYPISLHVKTLENHLASVVIHAQNVAGSANNYLDLYIYQFLGTGALTQPDPILIQRITLTNSFQKFVIPFIFPDAAGLTLGAGGDDALFLRVQYPLSSLCDINHTKPQIYLSTDVPDNDFDTYDQIGSIIDSPRTGDYRFSLNSFAQVGNFGWVAANDGSIGNAGSGASCYANSEAWPLYKLLWDNVLNNWAPVSTGRGASAYADFAALKTLTLTRNLGRVVAGLNPFFDSSVTFTANAGTDILTLTSARSFTVGTPVQVTNTGGGLPAPLTANTVYFVSTNSITTTTMKLSTTIENAYAGTDIDITTAGTGTHTVQNALGAYVGSTTHTLTVAEMPAHQHGPSTGGNFIVDSVAGAGGSGASWGADPLTSSTGGGGAHTSMQPTSYANVFFKL